MDGQRELEFLPSLREDADKLKKPPFPDRPSENFDEDFLPEAQGSESGKLEYRAHSLEIRIASVRTPLDVFRNGLAEVL